MSELDDARGEVFTAGDYRPVKRTPHQFIESVGTTEEKALRDLAGLLREWQEE